MNFRTLSEACFEMWKDSRKRDRPSITVTVLGPPGVGKTACGRHLGELMTQEIQSRNRNAPPAVIKVIDLSSMLPEDLMGLPFRDGDVTRYCPQSWVAPLCEEGAYGVLILDDLPAAAAQVQVACRQVSLERRIHEMRLSPGIFILVTGNRREDKSAASTLPAHFRNSVVLLPFSPSFEGWERWYMNQDFESDIPAFLRFRSEHFSRLPQDADKQGAFATPRSWSMLGQLARAVPETALSDVASGLVGQGVAAEYAAFRLLRRKLVDPEKVLEDPKRAIPDLSILAGPDHMIAMTTGLGEVAARKAKGPKKVNVLKQYLRALSWITSVEREYIAASISTFTACGGEMVALLTAARRGNKDPEIATLIGYLADTLKK